MYNDWQLRRSNLNTASRDYLCWSNYMLGNLLLCNSLHFDPRYFRIVSNFHLESIRKVTVILIWPYMGKMIICLHVDNPIYTSSNICYPKVCLNIDNYMYDSFRHQFLLMNSNGSSQCLTMVYKTWCWLGDQMISWPFNSQQIPSMNLVVRNLGWIPLAILPTHSPKSIACLLWPQLPLFLASRI